MLGLGLLATLAFHTRRQRPPNVAFFAREEGGSSSRRDVHREGALAWSLFERAPKVELHTHSDGSLQPESLCELAMRDNDADMLRQAYLNSPGGCRAAGVLDSKQIKAARDIYTREFGRSSRLARASDEVKRCADEIAPFVTSFRTRSLTEFLEPFSCVSSFILLRGGIEVLAKSFVAQQAAENVIYSEVQFAPQLVLSTCNPFLNCDLKPKAMMQEMWNVTARLLHGIASSQEVSDGSVVVRVLLDCFRALPVALCEQNVELAIMMKSGAEGGMSDQGQRYKFADFIVGINLAGDEINFPNSARPGGGESFTQLFERLAPRLREAGLGFAPHAAEPDAAHSADDCDSAFGRMGAQRVGHGYHCSDERLRQIARDGGHIEVCPASSVATGAVAADWEAHPIRKMLQYGVSMSLSTDDRAIIGTTMAEQHMLARFKLGFSLLDIIKMSTEGVRASFVDAKKDMLCARIKSFWRGELESGRLIDVASEPEVLAVAMRLESLPCAS